MKIRIITVIALTVVLLGMIAVFAQNQGGGFTGPGGAGQQGGFTGTTPANFDFGKIHSVTVEAAKSLPDDALVLLKGSIVRFLGDEKYMFRDATGEIVVDIDKKVWRGVSVGDKDKVEIVGEVDLERRGIEIDVKSIKKI
ncbi:MAG: YgiW/YdeI family stress tolerance OB fold protein [Chitinispirillia bacterium]|nr:YgiW/YdeI family stress tolerance OB fold protein [Chitinispirillia bacterium]MCL2267826.1 YgiW/YdeI family stress tolerance OB fold protein [Chitinispirillia bacterium]